MNDLNITHSDIFSEPRRIGPTRIGYATAMVLAAMAGGLVAITEARAQTEQQKTITTGAKSAMELSSKVEVERSTVQADGTTTTLLLDPTKVTVVPDDELVFTLAYSNSGDAPADNFVATNPVHSAVAYSAAREDWAEVSVDGGKIWGKLETLTVAYEEAGDKAGTLVSGTRSANAGDVTHVRWVFAQPVAAGAGGTLRFRGVVK